MLVRNWIAASMLLAVTHGSSAIAQQLPPVALSDDVAAVARIDLKQIELPAAKAAAASAFAVPDVMLAPLLQDHELTRLTLLKLGIDTVVIVVPNSKLKPEESTEVIENDDGTITLPAPVEPQRNMILLHTPNDPDASSTKTIARMAVPDSIEKYQWEWQGKWLVIHAKQQPLDPQPKRGQSAQQFEKGLAFLGRQPGIVIVPNDALRNIVKQNAASLRKTFPAALTDALDLVLASSWIAIVPTLGKDASLRFVAQMPDELRAKRLESALDQIQKVLANWKEPPAGDDGTVPYGIQAFKLVRSWKLLRSNTQTVLLLNAKQFGQLVDIAYLTPLYFSLEYSIGKERPWRCLMPLAAWLSIYQIMYRKLPDSLDDLKPVLGGSQVEQAEHLKRLLTNAATGEFPAVEYIKVPDATLGDPEDPVMLRELKDGVPLPGGISVRRSGHFDFGRGMMVEAFEEVK